MIFNITHKFKRVKLALESSKSKRNWIVDTEPANARHASSSSLFMYVKYLY